MNASSSRTTIADRARTLQSLIADLELGRRAAEQLEDFQQRRQRLLDALISLRDSSECLARLAKSGQRAATLGDSGEVAAAQEALRRMHTEFNRDPFIVLRQEFPAVLGLVQRAVALIDQQAKRTWQEIIEQHTTSWPPELLTALDRLEPFQGAVRTIRACQGRIDQLAKRFPPSEGDLAAFFAALEERTSAFGQLEALQGIPEPVVGFLKRCATSLGSPLQDVTPEIEEWLRSRNLLHYLRVVL